MSHKIRIATRKSELALWQANHVADLLRERHAGLEVELLPMVTRGDIILDQPLAQIGGKGLFLKELEKAARFLGDKDTPGEEHYLRSTVGGKVVLTPLHRVICLLAEDKYTTVVHEKGTTVVDDSLTELENNYADLFFRVHRNALVSRKHLRGLERTPDGQTQVLLSGTERRPEVSRRNVSALRKLLSDLT